MRLIAVVLLGVAIAALGFWLTVGAIALMGAWMVGFAMGVFLAAFAVEHKKDRDFRQELMSIIHKL